jgi:hypothetical protein
METTPFSREQCREIARRYLLLSKANRIYGDRRHAAGYLNSAIYWHKMGWGIPSGWK